MKNQADYSMYKCPYAHIKKECGHELHGPEGYENTHGIWCSCGFRGPVFCLDPEELKLERNEGLKDDASKIIALLLDSEETDSGDAIKYYLDVTGRQAEVVSALFDKKLMAMLHGMYNA